MHIFSECTSVIYLWHQLATSFQSGLILYDLHHRLPCLGSALTIQMMMSPLKGKTPSKIMNLLSDTKAIKKCRIPFIFHQWKIKKDASKAMASKPWHITIWAKPIINLLSKRFFWRMLGGGFGIATLLYIYMLFCLVLVSLNFSEFSQSFQQKKQKTT